MKMEGQEESGGRWRGRRKVEEDGGVGGKGMKMEGQEVDEDGGVGGKWSKMEGQEESE